MRKAMMTVLKLSAYLALALFSRQLAATDHPAHVMSSECIRRQCDTLQKLIRLYQNGPFPIINPHLDLYLQLYWEICQ